MHIFKLMVIDFYYIYIYIYIYIGLHKDNHTWICLYLYMHLGIYMWRYMCVSGMKALCNFLGDRKTPMPIYGMGVCNLQRL